ncbi:MAG: tetratricopeptide repeat protein [Rhodoferax sp.]|nr:tetratricopeptide repeat protein [Rhodoferax sp.]
MTRIPRLLLLTLAAACVGGSALGAPPKTEGPVNSNLDGELFYQLLVSELTAQSGDNGSAYAFMLDAARKANSPRLYERAVELALQGRSGESALEAAQAWARAFPSSREANRYQLQILLGLNRLAETQEPLKRELAALAPAERVAAISQLPRYFARTTDKKLSATVVEKILLTELVNRTTGAAAWAAIGTMRMQAQDMDGAMDAARRGVALNAEAEEPVLLAIALLEYKIPQAASIVHRYLAGKPTPDLRMAYARHEINAQRYAEAYKQMQQLTTEKPDFPEAWLLRGSLELQDSKLATAESSLKTYIALNPPPPADAGQSATMGRGLVQAYLLLAQVAEQGQRLDEAKAYLKQIDSPKDALRIQRRYAAILAREGKVDEARAAIHGVPELQPSDALDKINAEVQILRESRQYAAAYQLLTDTAGRYPDDIDVVYDLAMMAERLGKTDEMEVLLRRVMDAKPDYHHAYNALGYSLADRNIRLAEARALINRALTYAPDDPFIADSLAWVEFRSGNAAEALRLLKNAFQARPDAEIAAHLGEVLWTVGERDQASAIWKEGVGLNPQNETLRETMRRLRGTP